MERLLLKTGLFGFFVLLLSGCIEPYLPQEITSADNYLVVDALLEMGDDSLTIRLGRTQRVTPKSAAATGLPELQAKVSLEGDQGSRLAFAETKPGTYRMRTPALKETEQYRLVIKTSVGQQYHSAYVPVKKSPPIDDLTYNINPGRDGVKVYVSTHDAQNQTWFYRWKFEETYEYRALLYNTLEGIRDTVTGQLTLVPRLKAKEDTIKICWQTVKPPTIVLGTSIHLSQDVIQDLPILEVPASSHKLYYDYSLLVKQYALTKEAYLYWTSLAKTTETTGNIFDPMPSQVTANLTNILDAKEPVFGYFGISIPVQKRISIREYLGFPEFCGPGDCCIYSTQIPLAPIYSTCSDKDCPTIHYIVIPECTDCRSRGGTNKKPSFMK